MRAMRPDNNTQRLARRVSVDQMMKNCRPRVTSRDVVDLSVPWAPQLAVQGRIRCLYWGADPSCELWESRIRWGRTLTPPGEYD